MAVRLQVEILLPSFDLDQLIDYVVMQDELASGVNGEDAIAHEHVKPHHVLELIYSGNMPQVAFDEGRIPTGHEFEQVLSESWEQV